MSTPERGPNYRIDNATGAYLAAALLWAASTAEHQRARKAICRASLALAERCGVQFSSEIMDALQEGRIDEVIRLIPEAKAEAPK